ncbi:hypothetical protein GT204_13205 [Streptomyces sp. SID4919]|uniref:hypothetical protein n=1 Tax=unclassified Streptomyces TaxID=2593676 RepID=UPI000823EABB|nr:MULTISPECIES: hypothetical protein [unclassified Streptomyces]MYY09845.1 hypothetical protein [Streptomyces sp. SID4919]SCK36928.1 hypothetical protein YW7DRAFT_03111 [Streptomyces sp. AmelKG-E11A]
MNRTNGSGLALTDRLRIERAVWSLNSHLGDLPIRSKRAKRYETRANLYAAAADIGTAEAVRGLGDLRGLAADYLAAEYGERGPRPSCTLGAIWLIMVHVIAGLLAVGGKAAFTAGVRAAEPHATGDFQWPGVRYVINEATITFRDGAAGPTVGGSWTPLVYLLSVIAFVVGGQLWRLLPQWRSRYSQAAPQG